MFRKISLSSFSSIKLTFQTEAERAYCSLVCKLSSVSVTKKRDSLLSFQNSSKSSCSSRQNHSSSDFVSGARAALPLARSRAVKVPSAVHSVWEEVGSALRRRGSAVPPFVHKRTLNCCECSRRRRPGGEIEVWGTTSFADSISQEGGLGKLSSKASLALTVNVREEGNEIL